MMVRVVVLVLLVCTTACASVQTSRVLREELLAMAEADQAARTIVPPERLAEAEAAIRALDVAHAERLKRIIEKHGWPGQSLVGADAARAAWLIVQHADHDPRFQRAVLRRMEPLVEAGEVSAREFAYLWDRTHLPQRYGTQGDCGPDGRWRPREIEQPDEVDARRAAVGMFPPRLQDYAELVSAHCDRRPQADTRESEP